MKMPFLAALCAAALLASEEVGAITVRPPEGRIWQTCMNPSEDLKWPWAEGASSARVVFDLLCDGKSKTVVVNRQAGASYGTCAWPANRNGGERLYDITLTQLSGESVLETQTARVAMLPGVGGVGSATVRDPSLPGWGDARVRNPMFAYDAAWSTGEVAAVSMSVDGGAASPLSGEGGYDVLPAASSPAVSLLFDGVVEYGATCRYLPYGSVFVIR